MRVDRAMVDAAGICSPSLRIQPSSVLPSKSKIQPFALSSGDNSLSAAKGEELTPKE